MRGMKNAYNTETDRYWGMGGGFLSSYTLAVHTDTWGMNVTTYKELTKTGGMWLTSQTRHCSGALAHVQNLCKTRSGEHNWNT